MPPYERIVSLAPSNTEILYALDAADHVVATTAVCDYPDGVQDVPSIGGWTTPDIDAVAKHDPDLVLATDELQDAAVEACRDAGLRVKQFTPTRLHDVFNTIKAVGELVGRRQAARDLVGTLNERIHGIATERPDTPRVYCEEWHEPPMVGGNWIPRMVGMVGGEYLIEEGERSRAVDTDEIQAYDPEHIVLHYCGFGDAAGVEQVVERDGWRDITAVKEGNVHVVDDSLLNRPGPRLVEGMEALKNRITAD
jgi:iron complex transport system substrate-binding protein